MHTESNIRRGSSSLKMSSKFGSASFGSIPHNISFIRDYGGLGFMYYEKLGQDLDKILQVDINTSVAETKGSVRGRSVKLALEMKERGIVENDIIVICSTKNADQTIVLLASLFVGAIVAPLDPELSNKETENLIKKLKPKICFADSRTVIHINRIILNNNLNNTKLINFSLEPGGASEFSKLLHHKEDEQFRPIYIDDPKRTVAFILPTQGTTGFPKLVCLSHDNICLQCIIFQDIFHHPVNFISFFPLSWFFQVILVCVCIETLSTLIISGPFTERSACKVIQDFNVECVILGTDYAMRLCLSSAVKDYNLSCLKLIMIGVNNTTKHDVFTLKKSMPKVMFLCNYSLVETGCVAAIRSRDYNDLNKEQSMTVGSLTYNSKVKIINSHTMEQCGVKKYGEIYYSGDGLMLGYFKDPDATISARYKGYFKTGDIGMIDERGLLYVLGRFEDMIDFDNWSLSPMDIEDVILRHPQVKDAVVVGNAKEVVALVKKYPELNYSESDLRKHLNTNLGPKYWPSKIILQQHFPRTTIGSVKRKIIREDLLQVSIRYSSSSSLFHEGLKD